MFTNFHAKTNLTRDFCEICIVALCTTSRLCYSLFAKDHNFLVIYLLDDIVICNNIDANALFVFFQYVWSGMTVIAYHTLFCGFSRNWNHFAILHWSSR